MDDSEDGTGFQPWKVSRADVADGAAGRLWKGEMVMFLGSWAVGAGNFWEATALGANSCPWNHIFGHTLFCWLGRHPGSVGPCHDKVDAALEDLRFRG